MEIVELSPLLHIVVKHLIFLPLISDVVYKVYLSVGVVVANLELVWLIIETDPVGALVSIDMFLRPCLLIILLISSGSD